MGSEENQPQVSLAAQSPWKSLRDSHIPAAPARDRRGKWKSNTRIPHFPPLIRLSQNQKRKEINPSLISWFFRLIFGLENAPKCHEGCAT
jgi:hypothetical protein